MSDDLYNAAILRLKLAGETVHRLPAADGSATRVSPVCGSKIIADVALGPDGRIVAAGLDATKACTLGQASAAVVMARTPGMDAATLTATQIRQLERRIGGTPHEPPLTADGRPVMGLECV
jgi:NifU-like protein involved in Fe-S cluster formation